VKDRTMTSATEAFNLAVCEAFGLDKQSVIAIDVHFRPLEFPTATVTLRAGDEVVEHIMRLHP
jgi:hypothetical protein